MDTNFKKAQLITWTMMTSVIVLGAVAYSLSERNGYSASSEAKMNFMRGIIFLFSATQIALAFAIKKTIRAMSSNTSSSRLLSLQIVVNAFCEVIALFGLVLVFMSKAFLDYIVFALISLSAFTFLFPKLKDWEYKTINEIAKD